MLLRYLGISKMPAAISVVQHLKFTLTTGISTGANKWCLDKNYGSIFVLWDRIFGTFEPERENEEIVYGLTDQPQTYNILWNEV